MRKLMKDQLHRLLDGEISLNAAKTKAEEANRAKSEFLASMSHELRTPLNAVLGFSEIIESQMFGSLPPRYVEYARDIRNSGSHLLNLVNDILDLAKLDAQKMELRESEFFLQPIIEECLGMVQGRADKNKVTLSAVPCSKSLSLHADELRLKQVLLNLLSNAVKFTPEDGSVSIHAAIDGDKCISISIMDTGIGMTELEMEVALSPFGQVDSRTARNSEGTGLGLSISNSLMELHGGGIRIASTPGQGTTMTIWFPAYRTVNSAIEIGKHERGVSIIPALVA
jgi:signal transduction histidine kinase